MHLICCDLAASSFLSDTAEICLELENISVVEKQERNDRKPLRIRISQPDSSAFSMTVEVEVCSTRHVITPDDVVRFDDKCKGFCM